MNDVEKYLFDLQSYLVIDNALTAWITSCQGNGRMLY